MAQYVGTSDAGATDSDPCGRNAAGNPASGNNMVLVSESQYGAGCGCRAGQLTASIQHVDDHTARIAS